MHKHSGMNFVQIVHCGMNASCAIIVRAKEGVGSMSTDAKRAGNARHMEKLGRIDLRPYKEEAEAIRAAAAKAGQSTSAYILQAVRDRMERERPSE